VNGVDIEMRNRTKGIYDRVMLDRGKDRTGIVCAGDVGTKKNQVRMLLCVLP
jgi:hypothetical protein